MKDARAAGGRPDEQAVLDTEIVPHLPVGAPIYSRDGRRLGTVKEVRGRCFQVDVPLAFDYWLSSRCVAAVWDDQVRLAVDKRAVSDYLVDIECPDDVEEVNMAAGGEPALEFGPAGS